MAKKKEYKNKYKEAAQSAASPDGKTAGKGGRKKLTYKSYLIAAAIIAGFVAFFMHHTVIAIVAMVLFIISGIAMGTQNLMFLGIGLVMGVLIGVLNKTDICQSIALIWSLFYTVLMLSGMLITYRASRKK